MKRIKLWQDNDCESPRSEDHCNSCTMLSVHTRYTLEDKDSKDKIINEIRSAKKYSEKLEDEYDFSSVSQLFDVAMKVGIIAAYKNLYIYDHGSITIATSPFSCPWDSGQYGFAYITKEEARELLDIKNVTKKVVATLEGYIDSEVKEFDTYLTGDIYGFTLIDDDDDSQDSCGGFYTSDVEKNGMKEHIEEKYHTLLEEAEVEYD